MLVDIRLDDRVCLHVDGVSTAVGLDAQGKIRVWIDVPEEPSEEPEASILVAERGVAWFAVLAFSPLYNFYFFYLSRCSRPASKKHTGSFDAPVVRKLG